MANQTDTSQSGYNLAAIDQATLTEIVRQVLSSRTATVAKWRYDRVYGGAGEVAGVLSGVYRFRGTAHDGDVEQDWSVILKVVGTTTGQDNPADPRYWKREVLAYQSGKLADLPDGLVAPQFFGTYSFSENTVGLWLEDIVDGVGDWSLKNYGTVARHLGQFNGAFLVASELPTWSWLSQDWLRAKVNTSEATMDRIRQALGQPVIDRWFRDNDVERMLRFWGERAIFHDALDRLPQTLLHRDAFRRNLFIRQNSAGTNETVAVDWTYVGMGAVGEELTSMIFATLAFSEITTAEARDLDSIVFAAYLEGLADSGWEGDPSLVRLGYAAGSALCFGLGYLWFDPPQTAIPWLEQAFGRPFPELIELSTEIKHFTLDLADEARTLIADLEL